MRWLKWCFTDKEMVMVTQVFIWRRVCVAKSDNEDWFGAVEVRSAKKEKSVQKYGRLAWLL